MISILIPSCIFRIVKYGIIKRICAYDVTVLSYNVSLSFRIILGLPAEKASPSLTEVFTLNEKKFFFAIAGTENNMVAAIAAAVT